MTSSLVARVRYGCLFNVCRDTTRSGGGDAENSNLVLELFQTDLVLTSSQPAALLCGRYFTLDDLRLSQRWARTVLYVV
jgi:hypothetical protein